MPTNTQDRSSSTKWLALIVGAVVLGLLAWVFWPSAKPRPKAAAKDKAPSEPVAADDNDRPRDPDDDLPVKFLSDVAPGQFPAMVRGRPLIDGVTVEPKRICAGNPLVVRIAAHDPNAEGTSDLITGVGYERGSVWAETYTEPGKRQVLISAFNSAGDYEQRPLDLDVQDCPDAPLVLQVEARRIRTGTFAIMAKLPPKASPDKPLKYEWDFGDGTKATTTEPYLEYSYQRRPMTSAVSAFLIKVTATRQNDVLEGVTSVSLTNVPYLNSHMKGMVSLSVIVAASRLDGDAGVIEGFVLNHEREELRPDRLTARVSACGSDDPVDAPGGPEMMSTMRFPPGETPFVLRLPASTLGAGCIAAVTIEGETKDGRPVYASFGARLRLPSGPAPGQRSIQDQAKDDPMAAAQLARLQAAAKALGRDLTTPGTVITNEELLRLEAQGVIPALPPPPPKVQRAP